MSTCNVPQAAKILKVHENRVMQLIDRGELPAAKIGRAWVMLAIAEGFCRIMDTSKRHGDGSMIQQIRWSDGVLALVKKDAA